LLRRPSRPRGAREPALAAPRREARAGDRVPGLTMPPPSSPAAPTSLPPSSGPVGAGTVAVSCRGVTKVYAEGGTEVHALRGVDLEARTGELLLLVGPSGCGKTTLLSVVAGILDRTSGEVRVLGRDLHAMDAKEKTRFRKENLGFIFQQYNLLPTLSAEENV